ncbi:hypothetical protein TRFO_18872 [Tritrichomonas foetus]|uniref:Uncharacterized protein n=1 Tax=Tritrichomonas foetus TaxID=1144522 RepID=A0A1J4KQA3_9EUKA|nr:hypothetical protein TRFO_18872 [Tritrichomonas foetus]|eukprot:OHT11613.1 hypothetical protein TRFO_18872 [Tritrichomonas foetus]
MMMWRPFIYKISEMSEQSSLPPISIPPIVPALGNISPGNVPSLNIPSVPKLGLSDAISTSNEPEIPPLVPSLVPPIVPSISLSASPSNSQPSSTPNIPAISLPGFGLNLSSLTTQQAKKQIDRKNIVICLPFVNRDFSYSSDIEKLTSIFGQTMSHEEFTFVDNKNNTFLNQKNDPKVQNVNRSCIVVECDQNEPSVIPSFQMIDAAYQENKYLPHLISRVDTEAAQVLQDVESSQAEAEKVRAEREQIIIANAVLKEKIRATREEADKFNKSAAKMKDDFESFFQKFPKE